MTEPAATRRRFAPAATEIIGVPANSSGTVRGVALAPGVLRERGLAAALAGQVDLTDSGDLPLPPPTEHRGPSGLRNENGLIALIHQVSAAVVTARRAGRMPVLVGGDCPVLLGGLAALQQETGAAGLLFVDGHEDAWPPHASPTGEAADCELGMALGLFDDDLSPRLRTALPRLNSSHVAALGPRDEDELSRAGVASLAGRIGLLARPADLASRTTELTQAAVAALPELWWLHVDLDVLATSELTAVDYPQPGGLSWPQLDAITSTALAAPGCAGWSLCIYNPELDPARSDADRIIRYLARVAPALAEPRSTQSRADRRPATAAGNRHQNGSAATALAQGLAPGSAASQRWFCVQRLRLPQVFARAVCALPRRLFAGHLDRAAVVARAVTWIFGFPRVFMLLDGDRRRGDRGALGCGPG
jgi:arginase